MFYVLNKGVYKDRGHKQLRWLICNMHIYFFQKTAYYVHELSNAWKSYNLDPKNMVGGVTDTAQIMGAFGRQLPGVITHFYCVDHVIELTLRFFVIELTYS